MVDSAVEIRRCSFRVEKTLAVGDPVTGWGHFIGECWRKRSAGAIVAVNQFANEM